MEGAPVMKKGKIAMLVENGDCKWSARVKQEFDSRIISLTDTVRSTFEHENDASHSLPECSEISTEQYDPIEVPIEYAEETFPVNFLEEKLKTESLKHSHSNTQFIICQPSESLETVKNSWTHSMTYILIEEYQKLMSDFQDPHRKQKDSWVKLAENMCHRGCDVTWDMCDQKWRNLKHTFKSIFFNKHRSEKSKRRWDFYQALEDIFGPQLEAENLKKTSVISPNFNEDVSSKTEPMSKKTKVDSVVYPLSLGFTSDTGTFDMYDAESHSGTPESGNKSLSENVPPLWFQDFLKQYREAEERRFALVREMHNDLLQVERRKVAALEGLLMKF